MGLAARRSGQRSDLRVQGFTLIDLLVILVIIGVIAFTAIPMVTSLPGYRLEAAAKKLKADIRYAQELAMAQNVRYRVRFVGNTYEIVNDSSPAPGGNGVYGEAGEYAENPLTGGNFIVPLNQGEFAGVVISSVVSPCGSATAVTYIEFSSLGSPVAGVCVTLSAPGSGTKTIAVSPNTGKVS